MNFEDTIEYRIRMILQELLSMDVNDAASLICGILFAWLEKLSIDDISSMANTIGSEPKLPDYSRYAKEGRRRYYPIGVFIEILGNSKIETNIQRAGLTGWRELDQNEFTRMSNEVGEWLSTLEPYASFSITVEIGLRWAEQYNKTMGKRFIEDTGRKTPGELTDEQLTKFLRWVIYDELSLSDRLALQRPEFWPE
jgi:hypothetical protein